MSSYRILVIDSESVWRGGQQQILTLIEGIASQHQVLTACPQDSPLQARLEALNVPVQPFSQRSEFSLAALFRLYSLIRRFKPQLIHFNTPKPVLMGSLAARLVRPRPRCVASRRVVFPLASPLSRFKYSHLVDLTLTVSESIRALLIQSGVPSSRVRTVHEGVRVSEVPRIENEPVTPVVKSLVVGTVSHLSHEKGQETLIQAAGLLQPAFPEVRFVIIGDGADRASLVRLTQSLSLEKQVEFWGFREDADDLTREFDVFCLPSLSEGLSSAILSAMAAGLPIVASRVGGIPELVQEGRNGFLVPPSDPVALAEALTRLLESKALRIRMGQVSRKRAEQEFSLEAKIGRTLESYGELLESSMLR